MYNSLSLLLLMLHISFYRISDGLQPVTSTMNIIEDNGYPAELHRIVTEDGYVLYVHRIPPKNITKGARGIPVLVLHGLLGSSDNFVIMGAKKAVAFVLADQGYDVWLSNARGNTHSREHVELNPDTDREYWQFSFHEVAMHDLPATIEHISNVTGHRRLHYIGHSQGTTFAFAMLSEKPEYNDRLYTLTAYAPSAFLNHMRNPLLRLASRMIEPLKALSERLRIYELVLPRNNVAIQDLLGYICSMSSMMTSICRVLIYMGAGGDTAKIDKSIVSQIAAMAPAGGSAKMAFHYAQLINTGEFQKYDYKENNTIMYNSIEAPSYNLTNIKVPVGLFYGFDDWLCVVTDVERLANTLNSVAMQYLVPYKKFGHLDFILSTDAKRLVYDKTLKFLEAHESENQNENRL